MYTVTLFDKQIEIETSVSLFSPNGADKGTLSMLEHTEFEPDDKILDLGCGAGIVGIAACCAGVDPQNVVMTDVDFEATRMSEINMKNNGFAGATIVCGNALESVPGSGFTKILSNPPYHTDFSVAKTFIEKGFNRLAIGGRFYMVTKRKDWYKNKLISVFGGVKIFEDDNGYFVFVSEKRSDQYASSKANKNKPAKSNIQKVKNSKKKNNVKN